jgi:pimeloyl-ACP methyl ester carboxylesterase
MADFLLIHGSCHGAWCWRDVIPALMALGHSARAIDLPGAGDDTTTLAEVTLDNCRNAVLAAATPDTIVVGHSWGGFPISAAAEMDPKAMRALVFLCAYVPISGHSMVDMRKGAKRQLIMDAVQRDADGIAYTINASRVPDLFYHDCPPEAVAFAATRLGPQPIAPQITPLVVDDNFASVPKSYIRCQNDHTIPPEYQVEMTQGWPANTVYDMPTSHSPFFADPAGLASNLNTIARCL